jgi:hypothetical protein
VWWNRMQPLQLIVVRVVEVDAAIAVEKINK